jgi:Domain of unknown function (DUF4123)
MSTVSRVPLFEQLQKTQGWERADSTAVHWYALVDAAQDKQLPSALAAESQCVCLTGASWNSPLGDVSPWLVALPQPIGGGKAWHGLDRQRLYPPDASCATVIASPLELKALGAHFSAWMEVTLPEGDGMVLALWDPIILGTLVGQASDQSLHVPGPVWLPHQRQAFLAPIQGWWYWDRNGGLQSIVVPSPQDAKPQTAVAEASPPISLTQQQVDDLVEASVPDMVLYHVRTNQPLLLEPLPAPEHYQHVRAQVAQARALGIEWMVDLVNFTCAALIYGERMQSDASIKALLNRLKAREIKLDEALDAFPP